MRTSAFTVNAHVNNYRLLLSFAKPLPLPQCGRILYGRLPSPKAKDKKLATYDTHCIVSTSWYGRVRPFFKVFGTQPCAGRSQ